MTEKEINKSAFRIGMNLHKIAMSVSDETLQRIKPYFDELEEHAELLVEAAKKGVDEEEDEKNDDKLNKYRDTLESIVDSGIFTFQHEIDALNHAIFLIQQEINNSAERSTRECICPNCELYDTENPNYCRYAGEFTTGCNKCHYFVNKEKR